VICAGLISWLIYSRKSKPDSVRIFREGFYVDTFYNRTLGLFTLKAADLTITIDRALLDRLIHLIAYAQVSLAHVIGWFDKRIVDGLVDAAGVVSHGLGNLTRSVQGGKIQLYIFWSVLGLLIFLFFTFNT
jgi:NADH-quinone oxidoreductase subunit L